MEYPKKEEVVVADNATTITNADVMSDFKSLRCIAHTLLILLLKILMKKKYK
jgi:hypothetical protein